MPRLKTVTIEKDGIKGECLESAVPAWEDNGWTVVDDGSSEPDQPGEKTVARKAVVKDKDKE